MSYDVYRAKQNRVYDEFRASSEQLGGLRADPCIANPSAGYIVALRHPDAITQPFARYTASLRAFVPSLPYDVTNAHTTITVHEKQPLATFQPNPVILDTLSKVVAHIDRQLWQQVRIDFRHWYFNSETLIVAGEPNDAFWELGQQVQEHGAKHELQLRMPWGAHMTAGRFTKSCDAATVQLLRERIQDAPMLGISTPIAIHVGYYTSGEAGFTLNTVQAFSS